MFRQIKTIIKTASNRFNGKIYIPCIGGKENVMKVKKFLSAVISAAMCLSIVTANVSADDSIFIETSESAIEMVSEKSDDFQSISELGAAYRLEDVAKDLITLNSISSKTNDVAAYSANSAPVAGLSTMVVNPETLLNGSMTTETVVYWLWYDGETYYSYDPDGDEIVNYYVSGINDYILGTVTLDGEAIGFATQITVAAEYDLLFQVEDSNGELSNVLDYVLMVEPADGNTRPICNIIVSNSTPTVNSNVLFDWSTSTDADSDDYIAGVKVRVIHGASDVLVDTSSKYYAGMTNYGILLTFDEVGTYDVWISMSDNHNAWSNWNINTINVTKEITYVLDNVILTSSDVNNTNSTRFTWGNYKEAVELQYQTNLPEALFDLVTTNSVPSELQSRTIIGAEWTLSGRVKTSSGNPLSNATVRIFIPMKYNGSFTASVTTNSSGYFSYTCDSLTQWFDAMNVYYIAQVPVDLNLYGSTSDWCRYGDLLTTSWYEPTDMYVICDSALVRTTIPVTALCGCSFAKWLGYRWTYGIPGDSGCGWFDWG